MTPLLLREFVSFVLQELRMNKDAYTNAVEMLKGEYVPHSNKTSSTKTSLKTDSSSEKSSSEREVSGTSSSKEKDNHLDVANSIVSQWEKSVKVKFDKDFLKEIGPYVKHYARNHADVPSSTEMQKIIKSLNERFKTHLDKMKTPPSEASWAQVTQNVLDELEKFHNDKKTVPVNRKFKDRMFVDDLKSYLQAELSGRVRQKMTSYDIAKLVSQVNTRFNKYIKSKVPSK
jgi:hypothetical protein